MEIKVYILVDPNDVLQEPRYVGITSCSIEKRLQGHIYSAIKNITHKDKWINKLRKSSILPKIITIETYSNWDKAYKSEMFWIGEFKKQGHNLTNSTIGGEGVKGLKVSNETRQKRSIISKERMKNPELRERISQKLKGIKQSPEQIKKRVLKRIGIPQSIEQVENRRQQLLGHKVSEETREKIRKFNEKAIILTYPNGEIREFVSIKKCSIETGLCESSLWRWLNNKSNKQRIKIQVKYK